MEMRFIFEPDPNILGLDILVLVVIPVDREA
jgi:hypothetical protein